MKLHSQIMLGLLSTVFVFNVASAADSESKMKGHKHEMNCEGMGMHGDMQMDPSAQAQKHLGELKSKLNLTSAQEPAWNTFSEKVMTQAKNMGMMAGGMKKDTQSMPQTAPEQMAMMASMMKDRAQNMSSMSDAVKTFYDTLTPEQKMAFDKMHNSEMARMKHMGGMK
jgi:Spy/CpxP family protein refolding chaperone